MAAQDCNAVAAHNLGAAVVAVDNFLGSAVHDFHLTSFFLRGPEALQAIENVPYKSVVSAWNAVLNSRKDEKGQKNKKKE